MPSDRTLVTELGTGLGMLGLPDVETAVASRTPVMHSLSPELWGRLEGLRAGGAYETEFHAAWANGQAFLAAEDGLRGRRPRRVEWKGTGRAPGDEVAPIDLRVDHVYLVSCKYLSNILFNVAPTSVFDALLASGQLRAGRARAGGSSTSSAESAGGGDWFAEVAPAEYQALYQCVRAAVWRAEEVQGVPHASGTPATVPAPARRRHPVRVGAAGASPLPGMEDTAGAAETPDSSGRGRSAAARDVPTATLADLPLRAVELTSAQRDALGRWLRPGWPEDAKAHYVALSHAVARASAQRWNAALTAAGAGEAMLWRLLRIGSAPYFVLGSAAARSLRLRIATSWDWRQQFRLLSLVVEPQPGGQPRVGWEAAVRDRISSQVYDVAGHIEVRWSHGRFGGPPEAKGYLDTSHHRVPGYFSLQ